MSRTDRLNRWFEAPLVKHKGWAYFWATLAVVLPTVIRDALDEIVTTATTIFFVPGVLLAALFLGWRYAAIVALASALVMDWIFIGETSQIFEGVEDFVVLGIFLLASALIIASVELPRQIHASPYRPTTSNDRPAGIIFSLEGGQAFASWYGHSAPVRLGPASEVAEMMEDFLAQLELGKRLTRNLS